MKKIVNGISIIVMIVVLLASGIFMLVTGIGRFQAISAGRFQETQATITRIDTHTETDSDGSETVYDLTVEYTVDGKKVVSRLEQNPTDFYEGMELTVQYNMDKPTEVTLPGNGGAFIIIGMGVVALLACAALIVQTLRGRYN